MKGVRPLTLSLQLVPTIMKRFGFGRGQVAVNLDRTPLRAREQALFTSLPLRGLPLFWATSFAQIRRHKPKRQEVLVRRLVPALPEGVRPMLVADRGFGRERELPALPARSSVGRRASFILRPASKVTVEHAGRHCLLGEWPWQPRELLFLEGAEAASGCDSE
jgi:hypothetical protein